MRTLRAFVGTGHQKRWRSIPVAERAGDLPQGEARSISPLPAGRNESTPSLVEVDAHLAAERPGVVRPWIDIGRPEAGAGFNRDRNEPKTIGYLQLHFGRVVGLDPDGPPPTLELLTSRRALYTISSPSTFSCGRFPATPRQLLLSTFAAQCPQDISP